MRQRYERGEAVIRDLWCLKMRLFCCCKCEFFYANLSTLLESLVVPSLSTSGHSGGLKFHTHPLEHVQLKQLSTTQKYWSNSVCVVRLSLDIQRWKNHRGRIFHPTDRLAPVSKFCWILRSIRWNSRIKFYVWIC